MKKLLYLLTLQISLSFSMDVKAMEHAEPSNPFCKVGNHITRKIMQKIRDNDLLNLSITDKWTRRAFLGMFEQRLKEDTRGKQVLNNDALIIPDDQPRRKKSKLSRYDNQKNNNEEDGREFNFNMVQSAFNEHNPFIVLLVAEFFPNMNPFKLYRSLGKVAKKKIETKEQAYAAYLRTLLRMNGRIMDLGQLESGPEYSIDIYYPMLFHLSDNDSKNLLRIAQNQEFNFEETLIDAANYYLAKGQCLSRHATRESARSHFLTLTQALPHLDDFEKIDANFLRSILWSEYIKPYGHDYAELATLSQATIQKSLEILRLDTCTFINKTRLFLSLAKFLGFKRTLYGEDLWIEILEGFTKHRANYKGKSETTINNLKTIKDFLFMIYIDNTPNPKPTEVLSNEGKNVFQLFSDDKFYNVVYGNTISNNDGIEVKKSLERIIELNNNTHKNSVEINAAVLNADIIKRLLSKAKTNFSLRSVLYEFRQLLKTCIEEYKKCIESERFSSIQRLQDLQSNFSELQSNFHKLCDDANFHKLYDDVPNSKNEDAKRDAKESLEDPGRSKQPRWSIIDEQPGDGPWDFAMEPSRKPSNVQIVNKDRIDPNEPSINFNLDEESFNYGG